MKTFGAKMKKRKYNVIARKTGELLLTYIVYSKKVDDLLLKQFKRMKDVNISEVKECEEKI